MTSDSTLERVEHARSVDGRELVRYDKVGKWYVEWPGHMYPMEHVKIGRAADIAVEWLKNGGTIYPKQYGGTRFVSELRKRGVVR